MKYTKIICTIGPASEKVEMLKKMVSGGMNVARLNFSHGTYDNHAMLIRNVREVSRLTGHHVGILQDLQGPKIRLGELKKPVTVTPGQVITLGKKGLPVQYDLSKIVKSGQSVLVDDGLIELKVLKVSPGSIQCEIVTGGVMISHKGINVPESKTNFSVFTEKDKKDLLFGLKQGVDFVAMSFVRKAADIKEVKAFIKKHLKKNQIMPWVIAKIEKTQAIPEIDKIIAASDAIMIARGDLGIEAPAEMVPVYQKTIIKKCLEVEKPVIVATQMLDSMMRNPRPTRAEASDVSNAVFDHADCVMLSGESAFGKYPLESVAIMNKLVRSAEQSVFDDVSIRKAKNVSPMVKQAAKTAKRRKAALVIHANTPELPLAISNLRQEIPIYTYASSESLGKLSLIWGINANLFEGDSEDIWADIQKDLKKKYKLPVGTKAVFIGFLKSGKRAAYLSAQLKKIA
jgi:pyruvate kinase